MDDLAGDLERRAEQRARVLHLAAGTRPRMWLEETISPSTSTSVADAGLEALVGPQQVGVALRLVAEAEVLAHRRPAWRRSALDEDVVDELLRRCARAKSRVERDDDHLLDAQPADQLGLALEVGQQLGRRLAARPPQRVGIEGQHGVGAAR